MDEKCKSKNERQILNGPVPAFLSTIAILAAQMILNILNRAQLESLQLLVVNNILRRTMLIESESRFLHYVVGQVYF